MSKKTMFIGDVLVLKRGKVAFATNSARYISKYGPGKAQKILENLSSLRGELVFTQQTQHHTLLSILGNGRWRDRGISAPLLLQLLESKEVTKELKVKFKSTDYGLEPVVNTQSLQNVLTKIKEYIKVDDNGLTATLKYKDVNTKLNIDDFHRINNYL